ncbi:MAG: ATP synthase F1 subunit delta [bacterium]|nr:ATP synthase F1 subunit delta [bacterium]
MNFGSLARRYARALFQIAQEENSVEVLGDELEALRLFFEKNREAFETLANKQYDLPGRKSAVEKLSGPLKLSPLLKNCLLFLLDKNRFGAFSDIVREYGFLRDALLGWTRAELTTSVPLTSEILKRATKFLSEKTKKKIFLKEKVDGDMLGGVLLRIGGTLYDGSLRTELRHLREKLMREI